MRQVTVISDEVGTLVPNSAPPGEPSNAYKLSIPFYVFEGRAAILTASGFQYRNYIAERPDPDNPGETRPVLVADCPCAKIQRVLYEDTPDLLPNKDCQINVDYAFELGKQLAQRGVIEQILTSCGHDWQIDACDNLKILTVPGVYQLRIDNLEALENGARVDMAITSLDNLDNTPRNLIGGNRS